MTSSTDNGSSRTLRALLFELVADQFRALIVWPDDPPKVAKFLDRRKTWLTAQAGDVIVFKGEPETIKTVSLYRVHPVDQCDRIVTSGAAWLAGE